MFKAANREYEIIKLRQRNGYLEDEVARLSRGCNSDYGEIVRLRAALDELRTEALEMARPFARPQNPQALPRDFDAARRFYEKHKEPDNG